MTTNPLLPGVWAREVQLPPGRRGRETQYRAVLHTLASYMSMADREVRGHDVSELAEKAGLASRNVWGDCVRELAAAGVLVVTPATTGRTYRYRPGDAPLSSAAAPLDSAAPLEGAADAPLDSATDAPLNSAAVALLEGAGLCPTLAPTLPESLPTSAHDLDEHFDAWWREYPRKLGKPKAKAAYRAALKKRGADHELLMDGLLRWKAYWTARAEPEYVPHPTTWLHGERWNDDPPPLAAPKPAAQVGSESTRASLDRLRQMMRDANLPTGLRDSPPPKELNA